MAPKKHKPTTPSMRFTVLSSFDGITKDRPEKKLVESKKSKAGRNSNGRITTRHRGAGHKRKYRKVSFIRNKTDIPARVKAIEYDPNRSANIALLAYMDGEKRYINAPRDIKVGDQIVSGMNVEPVVGNALPMAKIPLGSTIHNIELYPGRGAQLVRSAGVEARLMSREKGMVQVKLPSGEIRMFKETCYATVGQVGNLEHESISLGKAGRKRWKGIRPTVRGVAMNPVDHPMGGGEGRSSGGGHPMSPWGQLAKGKKTRSKKKASDKLIVQRRK